MWFREAFIENPVVYGTEKGVHLAPPVPTVKPSARQKYSTGNGPFGRTGSYRFQSHGLKYSGLSIFPALLRPSKEEAGMVGSLIL